MFLSTNILDTIYVLALLQYLLRIVGLLLNIIRARKQVTIYLYHIGKWLKFASIVFLVYAPKCGFRNPIHFEFPQFYLMSPSSNDTRLRKKNAALNMHFVQGKCTILVTSAETVRGLRDTVGFNRDSGSVCIWKIFDVIFRFVSKGYMPGRIISIWHALSLLD